VRVTGFIYSIRIPRIFQGLSINEFYPSIRRSFWNESQVEFFVKFNILIQARIGERRQKAFFVAKNSHIPLPWIGKVRNPNRKKGRAIVTITE
jgi:hypothetical protein